MADEWYYWHEADVLGPFSGRVLVGFAADGSLLPTDVVWKEGVEGGVPASTVKHLFPLILPNAPLPTEFLPLPLEIAIEIASEDATAGVGGPTPPPAAPVSAATAAPSWFSGTPTTASTRRATAGKGALIVGQDGKTVRYRMKCSSCGHEDSSWKNMPITRGTSRVSFYCPKCRKKTSVEIHGHVS